MNRIKILTYYFVEFLRLPKIIIKNKNNQTPVKFSMWFAQRVLGFNRKAYWPVHFTSRVSGVRNIYVGVDTSPGYAHGCYIQAIGKIYIGDYTQIGPHVGIISSNHDIYDSRKHIVSSVKIGRYCWIGMKSIILPSVELGDFTIVAAGSVVTKSFLDGHCVIGGNPAKIIKYLEVEKCQTFKNKYEYNGYVPGNNFQDFQKYFLNGDDKW